MTTPSNDTVGQQRSHREVLLDEGLNQFYDRGYHATTVDGLLEATGVPKGSFYHHFGSKESFAATVLERYGRFHFTRLARWANRSDLTTADLLAGYFNEVASICANSGYRFTDLAGKLATEVAATCESLQAEIAHAVGQWRAQLEEILRQGQARDDVRRDREVTDLSAAIHAIIDGYFVIAASTRSDTLLTDVETSIRALVAPEQ